MASREPDVPSVSVIDEAALTARARRSYEWGRARAGLRGAWPLALVLPLALVTQGAARAPTTLAVAATLLVLAIVLGWRGGTFARGATAGFFAGLPPLILPAIVMARSHGCAECQLMGTGLAGDRWPECLIACTMGGVLAGVFVGLRAAREARSPWRFAASAALVAGITGALGCSLVGAAGAVGIFAGLTLGAAPTLFIYRQRAAS